MFSHAIRHINDSGTGGKPYDAEVEYIESTTDGQHIDTGITFDRLYDFEVEVNCCPVVATRSVICGTYSGSGTSFNLEFGGSDNGAERQPRGYVEIGGGALDKRATAVSLNVLAPISLSYRASDRLMTLKSGSDTITGTVTSGSGTSSNTLWLFNDHRSGGMNRQVRISSIKVKKDGEIVRDMIPVRVGGEYCLYDKANPTGGTNNDGLYHNAGSGVFSGGSDKAFAKLPYDAEVEYIESTGTQYIDTNLLMPDTYSFGLTFEALNSKGATWILFFGWRNAGYQYQFNYRTDNQNPGFAWDINSNAGRNGGTGYSNTWYTVECNSSGTNRQFVVNNSTLASWTGASQNTSALKAYLFASNVNGTAEQRGQMARVSRAWIKDENGNLVRDLIAVRVGNEFCMYDRVNPTGGDNGDGLYHNKGTGAFLGGIDKPSAGTKFLVSRTMGSTKPYDAEVEYVESNGTQYVDTGVIPTIPDDLTYEAGVSWPEVSTRKIMGRQGGFYFGVVNGGFQPGLGGTEVVSGVSVSANTKYDVSTRFVPTTVNTGAPCYWSISSTSGIDSGTVTSRPYSHEPSSTSPIWLFWANNADTLRGPSTIYYFKIIRSGTVIRDFQPVRIGQFGYLYDKASGELFGSATATPLIAGPDRCKIKPVLKHYDIATSYTIHEGNGNTPADVTANFPSGKYTALDYTPVWEHHRFVGWTTKPPYDAEIEYLESTGTQFIKTGITQADDLTIECTFQKTGSTATWGTYFGCGYSDNSAYNILGRHYSTTPTDFNPWFANTTYGECRVPVSTNSMNTVVVKAGSCVKDGTSYTISTVTGRLSSYEIYLFTANKDNASWRPQPCRISRFVIKRGSTTLADYIPVRVGTVGCIYDKVSGEILSNAGTGNFVKGGDTKVVSGNSISPSDDIIYDIKDIYATWQLPTTVTFDATTNGGQMPSGWTAPDYYEGQPYGTLPAPTKSGEVFLGWFTPGGTRVATSSNVSSGTLIARYAAVTWATTYSCTTTSSYKKTGIYAANRYSSSDPIVVDWGDGTTDVVYGNISQLAHTYPSVTTYTVKISDNISTFCPSYGNSTWYQTTSQNRYTFKKVLTLSSKVTQLSAYAFYYCAAMTDAIIPSGATSIPNNCFYYCSQLKSSTVQLPSTITSIGVNAFYSCTSSNFNSITIPAACTSIGTQAFQQCYYLHPTFESGSATLTLSTYSFAYCFYQSAAAGTIDLSQRKITSIPNYCFYYCRYLKGITWPQGLTTIGASAFRYCFYYSSSTGTVEIPEGVTSFSGTYAFANCLYLTAVTLPSTLTNLNNNTFYYCTRLATITSNRSTAPTVSSATFGNSTTYYTGRTSYSTGTNKLYVPEGATGYNASYWSSVLLDSTKCGFTLEEVAAGRTLPVTIVGSGYGGYTSYSMTIDDVGGTLTITNISGNYSFADSSYWNVLDFRATSTTESFVIMETATNSVIVVGLKTYGCSEDFVSYNGTIIDSADFAP